MAEFCLKKFHHFNLNKKTGRRVERYGGLFSILGWDSGMIITKIIVFFLQNYGTKIHRWTGQMVSHMLKLSGVLVQGGLVLASKILFPENASWLDGRLATF